MSHCDPARQLLWSVSIAAMACGVAYTVRNRITDQVLLNGRAPTLAAALEVLNRDLPALHSTLVGQIMQGMSSSLIAPSVSGASAED